MKLEEMYPNYLFLPPEGQVAYISAYRHKRMQELANVVLDTARKVKETSKNDVLSEEEKKILKKLGISMKDYSALNAISDDVEDDNPEDFFKDDSFDIDEEE